MLEMSACLRSDLLFFHQGTEEVFLKLLEETCDRVQTGLRP